MKIILIFYGCKKISKQKNARNHLGYRHTECKVNGIIVFAESNLIAQEGSCDSSGQITCFNELKFCTTVIIGFKQIWFQNETLLQIFDNSCYNINPYIKYFILM